MALKGKALHVGMVLWLHAGMAKSATVAVSISKMADGRFDRSSGSRALTELERAGLVSVVRGRGRKPRVTILPVSQTGSR